MFFNFINLTNNFINLANNFINLINNFINQINNFINWTNNFIVDNCQLLQDVFTNFKIIVIKFIKQEVFNIINYQYLKYFKFDLFR